MEKGLTAFEAQEKLKKFGKNEVTTKQKFSAISLFFSQLPSVINVILALAAIFSFFINNFIDGFFILAILVLSVVFGFIQEYRAEKALEKLKTYIIPLSRVIRDGKEIQIDTLELVPQDVVIVSEGDRVPADGKIITDNHLEVDESLLTGESLPVMKTKSDVLFSGTLITKGKARISIEKTGIDTKFGQIAKTLATLETEKTPLQKKLNYLGKTLSILIIIIAASLIPIGLSQGRTLFPMILLAVSIGVAAIPESLPAVVTITLAIGTSRMAKKHAIVRKMSSVETLGSVQIALIDKTGTLTQNKMKVKKYWLANNDHKLDFIRGCILGNTASLIAKMGKNEFDIVGDKTDGALLLWAKEEVEDSDGFKNQGKIVDEHTFDPERKTVTTVWEYQNKKYVFVRGAPEIILQNSKEDIKEKEKIEEIYKIFAKEGLRVIGIGTKIEEHDGSLRPHLEKNLNFLGIIGIYDPPREEARKAVLAAKSAGITTVMVTGDNELTALAIAKEVGLIEKDEDVVTGDELSALSDETLIKILPKTRIFARTNPEDKLRITRLLQKLGFVVAVTGDGVNDALALKKADVGVAMGESGTDVAKEASDIVLADDNFATLIEAVLEGRTIYSNILKSIKYLLAGNLSEIGLIFFAVILGISSPLLPTQILWINFVTDGLPALALASEDKNPNLMKRPPRDPNAPILTKKRLLFITTFGITVSAILIMTFSLLSVRANETIARTVVFNLLILFHLGLAFYIRGRLFYKDSFLIASAIVTIAAQVLITTVPVFKTIFHVGF